MEMTVKELIKELKKYDENKKVKIQAGYNIVEDDLDVCEEYDYILIW